MASLNLAKSEVNMNKKLNELYAQNKEKIIEWLDKIKVYDIKDNKIPGLFNKSKLQVITENKNGVYNLILKWIKNNMNNFSNYDFTNIPNSNFISLTNNNQLSPRTNKFRSVADVELWCYNSKIHPIKKTPMLTLNKEYYRIYNNAFLILKKNKVPFNYIKTILPKDYVLFGSIDILFYLCIYKLNIDIINDVYKFNKLEYVVCRVFININNISIRQYINLIGENSNMVENELVLLIKTFYGAAYNNNNNNINTLNMLINKLRNSFFDINYMNILNYSDKIKKIKEDNYLICLFIDFLENNKFSDGTKIIDYLNSQYNKSNLSKEWVINIMEIYNNYRTIFKDISECFDPDSGIIENYEDKKLLPIKDPLEDFFENFEKKLEIIRNPIYSKLIDLTTFKPKDIKFYLDDKEYAKFKKIKNKYDIARKKYELVLNTYELTGKNGSSPKPPEKPIFKLSNGKQHVIGREIDPIYIKDNTLKTFKIEYEKALPVIEEYNKVKNMSYLELKKYFDNSSSSSSTLKNIIKDNELLNMTKQEIVDNVLYDYSELADKCSESIDILTNEELDDENYPLAKLQLMVRLKVYIPGTTKYRTECIYAPKLYNYLIECINEKKYFINPVTKSRYTDAHIEELMKVMRIIDQNIEKPVFIKHRNDKNLKLEYVNKTFNYDNLDSSFGDIKSIRYYNIYLSRIIGGIEYKFYNICTIPMDIEVDGIFASGSSDITSNTMLFRIFKLFNEGKLLHNYVPPYCLLSNNQYRYYIKAGIHFNRYKTSTDWIKDNITKDEFVNLFKHYAEEINNFTY
jgi:hypothetical protein